MQQNNKIAWHTRDVANTIKALNSNIEQGLSTGQVEQLYKQYGKNILENPGGFTIYKNIKEQLLAPLSIVLIIALIVTLVLEAYPDSAVIMIALLINIIISIAQEGKSAKVFEVLARSAVTTAVVLRDGLKSTIGSTELVPGDIVYLEAGHRVPADIRIIELGNLRINESPLTGEWMSVIKTTNTLLEHDTPVSEQANIAFMGTIVTEGFGTGIVVATGKSANLGTLADTVAFDGKNTKTPLSENITRLAYNIVSIIGIAIAIIFAMGILHGGDFSEMLLLAVAVAVAAMPEGLPAAVTVTLAVAMEAVMKKGGLIKNLLAAETLGAATVILTDKTGTLTSGVMQMSQVHTMLNTLSPGQAEGDTLELLKMAALASDAFIEGLDEDHLPIVHGRPLEKAIVAGSLMAGLKQDELFKSGNLRKEFLQFEASRRYAVSLNERNGKMRMYITGSPEHVLAHATHYIENGQKTPLTESVRKHFKEMQDALSGDGKRLIAVAYRKSSEGIIPNDVRNPQEGESLGFVFGGLLSFSDSIRADVPESIALAKAAGVRVIMVTGDHGETAKAIAEQAGLNTANIILGTDFDNLADEALVLAVSNDNIFARMLPAQKLRLVTVLKEHGEVVAMTGDGVNDAPALVAASIGIAQGSGTDIAKEAADMILTTGSFSIIVTAIKEGRRALSNLRKIISYLLSTSASEIVLIGGSVFMGLPTPLLAGQILWANIVEEGFMSFPFAFEPADAKTMEGRPAGGAKAGIFAGGFDKMIFFISFASGVSLLVLYAVLNKMNVSLDELRTIMFAAVSLDSIFLAFSFKNLDEPLWHTNLFSNKYLIGGLAISLSLFALSLTWAPLMSLLSLTALSILDIILLSMLGIVNIILIELAKAWFVKE